MFATNPIFYCSQFNGIGGGHPKDVFVRILMISVVYTFCRNLSLGLATKARVCKVAGQEGSRESHNILPGM
jgi:hypothetical protein